MVMPVASIVPLPFGSGYTPAPEPAPTPAPAASSFNCAAPFRERLSEQSVGIYSVRHVLQLCRSLSGAVMRQQSSIPALPSHASIVPLPFGSGYDRVARPFAVHYGAASIVPLPFGSGYSGVKGGIDALNPRFNCAAPFRERLSARAENECPPTCRFNCAAPFRERLFSSTSSRVRCRDSRLQLCRSLSGAVMRL